MPRKLLAGTLRGFNKESIWRSLPDCSSAELFISILSWLCNRMEKVKKKKIEFVFPWCVLPVTSLSFIWVIKGTARPENWDRTSFCTAANSVGLQYPRKAPYSHSTQLIGESCVMKTQPWALQSLCSSSLFPIAGPGYGNTQSRW